MFYSKSEVTVQQSNRKINGSTVLLPILNLNFYLPPTKFGKGNIFTCVYQSFLSTGEVSIPGPMSFHGGGYAPATDS